MKIVLLGYMASGKSLIGAKLAKILDYQFIDLDQVIEKKMNASINNIFLNEGEVFFRKLENESLKEIITTKERFVLSLGGGTPCYANNMKLLLEDSKVETVYLKVSINNLVERLLLEPNKRPIIAHLKTKEELIEFVSKHLFERLPFYAQATNNMDANKEINEIIESILLELF